jgi:hypothetical protein
MYFDLNIPRQLDQPGFFEGKFPRWPEAEEKLHRNRMSQLSQEITAGIRLTLFKRYPLRKLAYGDLHPRPDEFPNGAVLLENCKLVTSYSWLALCAPSGENENPYKKAAICVPGSYLAPSASYMECSTD